MKKSKAKIIVSVFLAMLFFWLFVGLVYFFEIKLPDKKEKEEQLKIYKQQYAQKLIEFDAENKLFDELEVDIAFLGDSLTAGYKVENYYSEYVVVNRGIGGDTTYGLKNRLDVSVLELKPKVCVMLIGGNNPETMFEDYEDILKIFQEQMPETKVVLISHAPTSGPDWGRRNQIFTYNNVKIKLLAQKYGYEFVDIYTPLFDLKTGEMKAEYTIDGAHFTTKGYEVITGEIKPILDPLLVK